MASSPTTKKLDKYPPRLKGRPVVGNLLEFNRDPLKFVTDSARQGDIVLWQLLHIPVYQLNHPDYIEQVLVTEGRHFIKDITTRSLGGRNGNGLLISDGEFWLHQRRLMQPAFHKDRVTTYAQTMIEYTERVISGWEDGQERDIHQDMLQLTLDIVCKTLFGVEVEDKAAHEVRDVLEIFMHQSSLQRNSFQYLLALVAPGVANKELKQAQRRFDRIVYGLINQRRGSKKANNDLLSMLLNAIDEDGQAMTDKQLYDEVSTLLVAGHETTALALSWAWYLLAQDQTRQAKLQTEVQTVLQGRAPTFADLPHLPYTQAIITETLRLYPPAWGIGRESKQATVIGGYPIKARTQFSISQWAVQRDPRFFDEPASFQPERWDNDFAKRLPRFAYFPFGGGQRICIGNSFALMEAQLLLATIAQQFQLELLPDQKIELWPAITLRPKNGIKVKLGKRHG